jgi:hypothetical protein
MAKTDVLIEIGSLPRLPYLNKIGVGNYAIYRNEFVRIE